MDDDAATNLHIVDLDDDDDETPINGGDENAVETNGDGDGPIDLRVRNVVTMFNTRSHIDLREVTARLCHVVYNRGRGVVEKMMRNPYACIKIWSSGKVILTGCRSEQDALVASRRTARLLQKILGPKIKFTSYRVTNIMATCSLPFGIKIDQMARENPGQASYEPELNTGLIWKSITPKCTVRIHTTGSIIVTGAKSSADILDVLTTLYPILMNHRCQRPPRETTSADAKRKNQYEKKI